MFSEFLNNKWALASVVMSFGIGAYFFFTTLGIEVVVIEPVGCKKIAQLPPRKVSGIGIYNALVLKRNAKRLGADTVHIQPNLANVINSNKIRSGVAYDCSGVTK